MREGQLLRSDGTADCDACGLPLFPIGRDAHGVALECSNRHAALAPLPRDEATLRAVEAWIARKGAQLHVQHERWGTDDEEG